MLMTTIELANELNTSAMTLRIWLDNYRFSKYRVTYQPSIKYEICAEFWLDLYSFLDKKYSKTANKIKQKIAPLCTRVDNINWFVQKSCRAYHRPTSRGKRKWGLYDEMENFY